MTPVARTNLAGEDLGAVGQGQGEAVGFGAGGQGLGMGEVDRGITSQLGQALAHDVGGRDAVLTEEAVRGGGEAVAGSARVNDQQGAPRPRQLHRRRQTGETASDHDDVVPIHGSLS